MPSNHRWKQPYWTSGSGLPISRTRTEFMANTKSSVALMIRVVLIIAYFGLFLGIHWLWMNREKANNAIKLLVPYFRIFLFVAVLGYILGIILWPYALHNPFKNPFLAFKKASDNSFYTNNVELSS